MAMRMSAATIAACLLSTAAFAQTSIEWKQTLNMPKGTNLPAGLSADILGIAIGDDYKTAKARLQALMAEKPAGNPPEAAPAKTGAAAMMDSFIAESSGAGSLTDLQELQRVIYLDSIKAAYVGKITMTRPLKVDGMRQLSSETVQVYFSAPSSGHQVIAIERSISYLTQADQIRIPDFLQSLREKYGADPHPEVADSFSKYRWQFNDGRPFKSNAPIMAVTCNDAGAWTYEEMRLPEINKSGECDVFLVATFNHGISPEHARTVGFILADNERIKANYTADYAFFQTYIEELRGKTAGQAPKL